MERRECYYPGLRLKSLHLSKGLHDRQDQIHYRDALLICNQGQEFISLKNKAPSNVDVKKQSCRLRVW